MYCGNCGAEISESDAYCPYCGVMNARAAEKEYMNKLEGIMKDTEELGEESEKQTRIGIRKAGRLALRVFLIIGAVVLGLFIVSRILERKFIRNEADWSRQEAAFKADHFPKLDELYEAGDDRKTMEYMWEIGGEDGATILHSWKHYQYMVYYMDYFDVCSIQGQDFNDDFWKHKYPIVLEDGIELIYQTDQTAYRKMNAEEKEKVEGYRLEAERIIAEYLSLDKSDLDKIYESAVDESGYLYKSKIYDWAVKDAEER